jgi:hypothetical protein
MDGILLQAHGRKLREEVLRQARVHQEPEPLRGMIDHDELVELVPDPFSRHDRQPVRHRPDRGYQFGQGLELVSGDEPSGAEHAERIVAEADLGRQRGSEPTSGQVTGPVEGIHEHRAGAVSSSAMAFTVKSRRDRSVSTSDA